jgi:hypothetical protein
MPHCALDPACDIIGKTVKQKKKDEPKPPAASGKNKVEDKKVHGPTSMTTAEGNSRGGHYGHGETSDGHAHGEFLPLPSEAHPKPQSRMARPK